MPAAQVDALLAARGISEDSRVPVGFEYRVPNPLAARADAAEARSVELEQRAAAAEHTLADTQRTEELRAEQRRRLRRSSRVAGRSRSGRSSDWPRDSP